MSGRALRRGPSCASVSLACTLLAALGCHGPTKWLGSDYRSRDGGSGEVKWPWRYVVRRIAWHVLDHAWEIEDRSD